MKKLTQEQFIAQCRNIWGDRYDLSKTVYINKRSKIIVTCRKHGDFEIKAGNFIHNKTGCMVCGRQKPIPTSEFIEEARSVHGDRYDYSKSNYVRYNTRLTIICREHSEFHQEPYVHLRGSGCPHCGGVGKMDTERFIAQASVVHGGIYSYSKTVYTKPSDRVVITCPIHGDFEQLAYNHLAGRKCLKCGNKSASKSKTMPFETALRICKDRGIALLKYAGDARKSSDLQCGCGHLWRAPISRINRDSLCPACAIYGYNPAKRGSIYALLSADGKHMKIGLSNRPKERIKTLVKATPFPFTVFSHREMSGPVASRLERHIHKMCKPANLSGFDGCTEWFHVDQEILELFTL